jgi:glycolate oxidase iron-sulfur subunit
MTVPPETSELGDLVALGDLAELRELTDSCVHCGFCLPACPTYDVLGDENDSPRGSIHLARQLATGVAELDDGVAGHFDACLGCLACVPACPTGVRYDRIIEHVRPVVERARGSRRERIIRTLIFAVFPRPWRLRLAATLGVVARRLGLLALVRRIDLLATLDALLPRTSVRRLIAPPTVPGTTQPAGSAGLAAPAGATRSTGAPTRDVALVTGCVQRVLFADVNAATARVLAADGCRVRAPRAQGCCGALSLHAGRIDEARRYARRLIDDLSRAGCDDSDTVVVNVAGCGAVLKDYGTLLADDPDYAPRAAALAARVRDVTEVLAELPEGAPRHPIAARVAYHDACHLSHGQGVRDQPRQVLRAVPELDVVEPADQGFCCGSAGIYNLTEPTMAAELGRRKADRIRETGAEAVVAGNPGCLLQIQRYLDVPVVHPVQVIDASIRGTRLLD